MFLRGSAGGGWDPIDVCQFVMANNNEKVGAIFGCHITFCV